jgi:hypothetical protein
MARNEGVPGSSPGVGFAQSGRFGAVQGAAWCIVAPFLAPYQAESCLDPLRKLTLQLEELALGAKR